MLALAAGSLLSTPVERTILEGEAGGFLSGLQHPISGWDHILAMVSVGLWGAQLGAPAIWLLPVTFPIVMAFGGFLGLVGVPFPSVEIGIALSALLLGAAVMTQWRPPLLAAAALVGVFALFHGHAHGAELPPGESGLLYSIGFVGRDRLLASSRHRDRVRCTNGHGDAELCKLPAPASRWAAFTSLRRRSGDENLPGDGTMGVHSVSLA